MWLGLTGMVPSDVSLFWCGYMASLCLLYFLPAFSLVYPDLVLVCPCSSWQSGSKMKLPHRKKLTSHVDAFFGKAVTSCFICVQMTDSDWIFPLSIILLFPSTHIYFLQGCSSYTSCLATGKPVFDRIIDHCSIAHTIFTLKKKKELWM